MPDRITIAVVDDEKSFRESVARLIQAAGMNAATFATAADFLANPIRDSAACALVDLRMPGLSGLDLQEGIARIAPHLSVVFLTGHGEVSHSVRAMKAGAVDFLEKPVGERQLLAAIRRATERTQKLKESDSELVLLRRRYELLTPREREVFALVAAGLLNKQIGFELGTTESTIKVHRGRVMEKMRAQSLADLVRMADRLGIERVSDERREAAMGLRRKPRSA
jgi:FixJ family two-component response regulator